MLNDYPIGYIDGKKVIMSRFIMNYSGDLYIDHINNNKNDNRKENLRIVTAKQNLINKSSRKNSNSQYLGVYKSEKKWKSSINVDGKNIHLGTFDNEIEDAKARDIATKEHYKEYGNLNFITI